MEKPKVSICVVTYNHENYISDCLNSILSQQIDFDIEILIADDISTDNTKAIIENFAAQYPQIIKLIVYPHKVGTFYNFNFIHSQATGQYVCHCDGDDLFLPGKLQQQANFLDLNQDYAVVWHKSIFFNDEGVTAKEYLLADSNNQNQIITIDYVLRTGTVATHSSIMYRKSARKTYDLNLVALDLFFTIEYLLSGKGCILINELGKYRVNSSSSISKNKKGKLTMRKLCIEHWSYYLKILPQYRSQILIFSIINFLIDVKNKRYTCLGFLKLMFKSMGTFNVKQLTQSIRDNKTMSIPSVFYK